MSTVKCKVPKKVHFEGCTWLREREHPLTCTRPQAPSSVGKREDPVNRELQILTVRQWLGEAGKGDVSPDRFWESATYPQTERGRRVMEVFPASVRVL